MSESGHDGAWDVHRPHGPEALQLHPMRALTASAIYLLTYIMSSRSSSPSVTGANYNNWLRNTNTNEAGANWARQEINSHNLRTVAQLKGLITAMEMFGGARWYRGGKREIQKRLDAIHNRRVRAARTAAANLRRLRRLRTIGGLVNREVGTKRRRFK